jgi:uncharacterized repeat protein (TIGR02543 family)
MVTGNITLYAKWDVAMQAVSEDRVEYYWIDEHGNLATTSGGAATVAPGGTLTITAQSAGYIVRQWHLDGIDTGQSGNTYTFSSTAIGKHTVGLFVEKDGRFYNTNITITVGLYTVTFNANSATSGTTPSPQIVQHGSNITLPGQGSLLRTGYTFGGWNTNSSGTGTNYNAGAFYTPTGNITLYARWTQTRTSTVTIAMYDSYGDGWNGCALRINVNGVQRANNATISSGSTNTYTFSVTTGDIVQLYWVAGSYQDEVSFIVYYADTPPSPAFTASNNSSWSGSNALIYRLRGAMNNISGGTLLGSFTAR